MKNTAPQHSHTGVVASSVRTAVAVPRWAFGFYLRHVLLVVGISMVPAVHRFVVVLFDPSLPDTVGVSLEILVACTRLVLVGLIVWLAISRDGRLRQVSRRDRWKRIRAFARFRWPSLIVQLILIAGATLVFNVFLEQIVTLWIPNDVQRAYMATLLAVKNPTVIAWVLIWMVGIIRQMMLYAPAESADTTSVPMSSDTHQ